MLNAVVSQTWVERIIPFGEIGNEPEVFGAAVPVKLPHILSLEMFWKK